MSQNQTHPTQDRQKLIDLWVSAIFAVVGIAFFAYEVNIGLLQHHGQLDFGDRVLMPTTALMALTGIVGLFLILRNHQNLGAELLFYGFVLIPPIFAVLSLIGIFYVAVLYTLVLAPIVILLVVQRAARTRSVIAAGAAIMVCAAIEYWNPGFRVGTSWGFFATPMTVAAAAVILAFLIRQLPNLSLRLKVIIALVGITALTIAILASYLINQIYQNAYSATVEHITTENQEHILSIQTFLLEHSQDVVILSRLPDLRNLIAAEQSGADPAVIASDTTALKQDLQAFFDAHPVYDNVRFIDANGQEVVKVTASYISTTLQNKASRPFFSIPAKMPAGSLYLSPLELEQDQGKILVPNVPVVRFATPVYYNNRLAGVVVANIVAKNLLNILNDSQYHVMMVDQKGFYLYDNLLSNKLFGGAADLKTGYTIVQDMPNLSPALLSGNTGSISYQKNIYIHAPIAVLNGATPNWYLIFEVPQADIYAPANRTLTTSVLILAAILILAIIVAVYLGNSLTAPLIGLTEAAKEVAQGNLSVQTKITSNDEIGVLANTFNLMTSQLNEQIQTLDQRVAERTRELEVQAVRVRSASEIARDIASSSTLEELLTRSSQLIVERFRFYHAGIFILDDKKEYAILRASPTEAGKQLIANSHRLRVGEQGIVGRVAASGAARIALDTGADAVYFNNPFLPNTRSEMALPLRTRDEIFGVLDIQSEQPQAFAQQDVEILQVLADQLAIAMERINLLEQVEGQLKEIEKAYQVFTQRSWEGFTGEIGRTVGYKFDGVQLQPIKRMADAQLRIRPTNAETQAIPIRLRGLTIGYVNLRGRGGTLPNETISLVEQISDRLASGLENARLAEETRERAQQDALVAELTNRFRSSLDLEAVLRTAAQDLQKAFQLEEAEVRLGFPTSKSDPALHSTSRKNGESGE